MSLTNRERFLSRALPNKRIDSAGTGARRTSCRDERKIAKVHGLSLEGHKGNSLHLL